MKLLVIIPARGGSKGLPGKNLLPVGGISLVGRAVRIGRATLAAPSLEGRVLVDTDSPDIAEEGTRWGAEVPFLREASLAGDTTPMIDNVLSAVDRMAARGFAADTVLLLQPTSPLRTVEDVAACLTAYDPQVGSLVAVVACDHPPEQSLRLAPGGTISWAFAGENPTGRRQDFAASYRPAGSVYVNAVTSLRGSRSFFLPGRTLGVPVPRAHAVDIDDLADLELARALHAERPRLAAPWPAGELAGFTWPADAPTEPGTGGGAPRTTLRELGGDRTRANGARWVAEASPLPALLAAFEQGAPPSLIVAGSLVVFRMLRACLDYPVILASSEACEHAVALALGAPGFVAPAELHPVVREIAAAL